MVVSVTIAPPNSLISVCEGRAAVAPDWIRNASIAASESCILIACLMFADGETKITLGAPLRTKERPAFDGFLDTPDRSLAVWTIEWKKLLETKVPTPRTRVRVWTNHPTEPDDVYIGVGEWVP